MIHNILEIFAKAIKWTIDNPSYFFVAITTLYCLIVIIGAQLSYSKIKKLKSTLQEIYSELDNIAKDERPNAQHLQYYRNILEHWIDKAIKIITISFGQDEAKVFIDKRDSIKKKDEYHSIGGLQAFYNEKQIYLKYLENLLDLLEDHPELWR